LNNVEETRFSLYSSAQLSSAQLSFVLLFNHRDYHSPLRK
jgi:hypothetical protein